MIAVVRVAFEIGEFEEREWRREGKTSRSQVAIRFAGSG